MDDLSTATDRDLPTTDDGTTTMPGDDSSITFSDPGATTDDGTVTTDGPATTTSDRGVGPIDSTTTTPVTDDTTSSTATTTVCQAEQTACIEDPDCSACSEELATGADAVEAVCRGADYEEETATCAEKLEVGCCSVAEGPDCVLANAALVAWIGG